MHFIRGVVDGVLVEAVTGVTSIVGGLIGGLGGLLGGLLPGLNLDASSDTGLSFSIDKLKPQLGSFSCNGTGNNVVVVAINDPSQPFGKVDVSSLNGGSCTVTVTGLTSATISGTFAATLKNTNGTYTRVVTNGEFSVAR